ncbi:MAG: hypothetical protein R3F62_19545 [Planctomycetota bacterium]
MGWFLSGAGLGGLLALALWGAGSGKAWGVLILGAAVAGHAVWSAARWAAADTRAPSRVTEALSWSLVVASGAFVLFVLCTRHHAPRYAQAWLDAARLPSAWPLAQGFLSLWGALGLLGLSWPPRRGGVWPRVALAQAGGYVALLAAALGAELSWSDVGRLLR